MADEQKRETEVVDLGLSVGFDMRPYSIVTEMKRLLAPIADEGSSMDSGTMDGEADLYLTVGGVEFFITVKLSNSYKARVG